MLSGSTFTPALASPPACKPMGGLWAGSGLVAYASESATAVIKDINPVLLKTYAVEYNFLKSGPGQGFPLKVP